MAFQTAAAAAIQLTAFANTMSASTATWFVMSIRIAAVLDESYVQ
jgi:hypothetical protein